MRISLGVTTKLKLRYYGSLLLVLQAPPQL